LAGNGAWVVYDLYWDPHASYATKAEAEAACQPGSEHAGCHPVFDTQGTPGELREENYGHWDGFKRDVLGEDG
jgi:hypothetical protein